MGDHNGGMFSIRFTTFSISTNRIFRAALRLVRCLVGASALHPDIMCATLSGQLPYSCLVPFVELRRE